MAFTDYMFWKLLALVVAAFLFGLFGGFRKK